MAITIPLTESESDAESHVNTVINRIFLHKVLDSDGGRMLTTAERDLLCDYIDIYLDT